MYFENITQIRYDSVVVLTSIQFRHRGQLTIYQTQFSSDCEKMIRFVLIGC